MTYTTAGLYTYSLLNTVGCDSTRNLDLRLISMPLAVDQNISCYGINDGSIQAETNASGSWIYTIDGDTNTSTSMGLFVGLAPGLHTICAFDGTGTYCDTMSLVGPSQMTAYVTVDSIVSCHVNDGQLSVHITGGTTLVQSYLTTWTLNNGPTLNPGIYDTTVNGLVVGTYNVHIEDDYGCGLDIVTALAATTPLAVTASANALQCYGDTTTISSSSIGGETSLLQPYVQAIGSTQLPATFSAGTYTVISTDARACTATTVITIAQPAFLHSEDTVDVCDPYTWMAPATGLTYTVSGTYIDTITSTTNCDSVLTLYLTIRNSTISNNVVYAANSYAWTNGMTYTTAGLYTYSLLNTVGCDSTRNLDLRLISMPLAADQNISCYGVNDGSIQAETNASGNWIFTIDGDTNTSTSTGLYVG
jgi:hypothetical protein